MNPAEQVDNYLASITDPLRSEASWRGVILTTLRKLIHEADPEIVEEWKWDVPVFTHKSMVCAISAFKDHVKINFFKGAQLSDPHKIINAGLESKNHRSIDFFEGDTVNEKGIIALVEEAVTLNRS